MEAPATSSQKVRIAIVGVGNCASSLVQGLSYYRNHSGNEPIAGLMSADVGGYEPGDIAISAAFDVNAAKVGRDVSEAIFATPNNADRFADVPATGVRVERGPTLDGIGEYVREMVQEADTPPADITAVLKRSATDIMVSYLPVGSQRERTLHFIRGDA
jgi:myo-inositol-1-phosphate synthase